MDNQGGGTSAPPPQQDWQSQPQQPAGPPPGSGQGPSGGPSWTSNITAQGTIAGPGGVSLADIPNRIIAIVIDFIILGLIGFVVSAVLGGIFVETRTENVLGIPITVTGPSMIAQLLTAAVLVAISAAYFIYMWTRMNGATVGMQVLKLQVRDAASGGQVTQDQAIRRWLFLGGPQALGFLYVLPAIGILVSLAVLGYYIYLLVTTAQDPQRRGLHDKQANTVVAKVGA